MIKVDVIFINAINNAIFGVIVIQIIIVLTLPSLRMGESGRGIKKRTSYAALSSQPVWDGQIRGDFVRSFSKYYYVSDFSPFFIIFHGRADVFS